VNEDLIKRLKALIFIRALFVTILLGSLYVLQIGYRKILYPEAISYLIVVLYTMTIAYILAIKRTKKITLFAYIQIIGDIIAGIALIYLTGGIESWFSFILLLSIISASIVLNRRASVMTATLSSILYGLLINFQFYNILQIPVYGALSERDFFYNIFAHITAFYLVAYLSGNLSERLRRVTVRLEEKDIDLRDLKAFSRDVIESIPSGLFTMDLNGRITTFNEAAQRITGKTLLDVIGRRPEEIFPFLENLRLEQELLGNLKNLDGPTGRLEGGILKEGERIIIGMGLSTLTDSSGRPVGTIGIFQDLTNLRMMEAEIRKKEKWAAIGELSAWIAHELRNPIASLKGSIEMLREGKVAPQHGQQLMDIASSEMDRLNTIITDFLLYARPKPPGEEVFDLNMSLRDIIVLLQSSESAHKNIKIAEHLNGELFIKGDLQQLRQVFLNLGINAIDAIQDEGKITVSTERKNDIVEINFSDTGVGISKEDMEKIFYPFFTTKDKGTGLGLSIAQRIVEEHGGSIIVQSKVGSGTTFKVVLPVKDNGKVRG